MKKLAICGLMALAVALQASSFELNEVSQLFLVGDAMPDGWNRDKASKMQSIGEGLYAWHGTMQPGQFKMITSRSTWNSLVADVADRPVSQMWDMPVRPNDDGGYGDYKWVITEPGMYTLLVNLNTASLYVSTFDAAQAKTREMRSVAEGKAYKFTEPLKKGKFRIRVSDGKETRYVTMSGNGSYIYSHQADFATVFPVFGAEERAQVLVNADSKTAEYHNFIPWDYLYMTGSFNGWALDCPLERNPDNSDEFEWSGTLKVGKDNEIKFVGAPTYNDAFKDHHMHPYAPGEALASATEFRTGGEDTKWTVDQAGKYTIKVDTYRQTMTVTNNTGGVRSVADGVSVYAGNGRIDISAPETLSVAVYDIQGKCLAQSTRGILSLDCQPGIYVVKVGTDVRKVIVKP